jgi:hypothetical protein
VAAEVAVIEFEPAVFDAFDLARGVESAIAFDAAALRFGFRPAALADESAVR